MYTLKGLFSMLSILTLIVLLNACGGGGVGSGSGSDINGDPDNNPVGSADTDSDGLTDEEELAQGTNPAMADTDGDGFDDQFELLQFNAVKPYQWNPRISDVPQIELAMAGTPVVRMVFEKSEEGSVESSTATVIGSESSQSFTYSNSQSFAHELNVMVGLEAGYADKGPVAIGKLEVSYGYSTETAYSWDTEQSQSRSMEYETATSTARSEGMTFTGGVLQVPLKINNPSHLAYTVTNLAVIAKELSIAGPQYIGELGLEGSGTGGDFPSFTLQPGDSKNDPLLFEYEIVNPELARKYASGVAGIVAAISGYRMEAIVNGNTTDFTDSSTSVAARTARIIVDPGPTANVGGEKNLIDKRVATFTKFNTQYSGDWNEIYADFTLADALTTLQLPYRMGESQCQTQADLEPAICTGITSINGTEQDPEAYAHWYVAITRPDANGNDRSYYYSAALADFDPTEITISAGDTVHFIYSKDADQDGVPLRLEILNNASDEWVDTDADGWDDLREIFEELTRPDLADTDGDGWNDSIDDDPLAKPRSNSNKLVELTWSHNNGTLDEKDDVVQEIDLTKSSNWVDHQGEVDQVIYADKDQSADYHEITFTVEGEETLGAVFLGDLRLQAMDASERSFQGTASFPLGVDVLHTLKVVTEEDAANCSDLSQCPATEYKIRMDSLPGMLDTITTTQKINTGGKWADIETEAYFERILDERATDMLVTVCKKRLEDMPQQAPNMTEAANWIASQNAFPLISGCQHVEHVQSSHKAIHQLDTIGTGYYVVVATGGQKPGSLDYVLNWRQKQVTSMFPPKMAFNVSPDAYFCGWADDFDEKDVLNPGSEYVISGIRVRHYDESGSTLQKSWLVINDYEIRQCYEDTGNNFDQGTRANTISFTLRYPQNYTSATAKPLFIIEPYDPDHGWPIWEDDGDLDKYNPLGSNNVDTKMVENGKFWNWYYNDFIGSKYAGETTTENWVSKDVWDQGTLIDETNLKVMFKATWTSGN